MKTVLRRIQTIRTTTTKTDRTRARISSLMKHYFERKRRPRWPNIIETGASMKIPKLILGLGSPEPESLTSLIK
jgi:hypothetical protein